jgi:hypothetical protein
MRIGSGEAGSRSAKGAPVEGGRVEDVDKESVGFTAYEKQTT